MFFKHKHVCKNVKATLVAALKRQHSAAITATNQLITEKQCFLCERHMKTTLSLALDYSPFTKNRLMAMM